MGTGPQNIEAAEIDGEPLEGAGTSASTNEASTPRSVESVPRVDGSGASVRLPPEPPEGLRKVIAQAIWDATRRDVSGGDRLSNQPTGACYRDADAVLAALFEACEVREDFPMTYTTRNGLERTVPHMVHRGAVANARDYARDGFLPARVEHRWTLRYSQPVMRIDGDGEPVSSTGEESTGA